MANYCRLLSQRCVYGFNVNWCSSDIIQMTLNEKILDSSAHCRSWVIFLSWVWFSLRLWKPRKIEESREDMSPLIELRYYVNPNVPWGSGILRLGWFVAYLPFLIHALFCGGHRDPPRSLSTWLASHADVLRVSMRRTATPTWRSLKNLFVGGYKEGHKA